MKSLSFVPTAALICMLSLVSTAGVARAGDYNGTWTVPDSSQDHLQGGGNYDFAGYISYPATATAPTRAIVKVYNWKYYPVAPGVPAHYDWAFSNSSDCVIGAPSNQNGTFFSSVDAKAGTGENDPDNSVYIPYTSKVKIVVVFLGSLNEVLGESGGTVFDVDDPE
jgi:hypothetical protein